MDDDIKEFLAQRDDDIKIFFGQRMDSFEERFGRLETRVDAFINGKGVIISGNAVRIERLEEAGGRRWALWLVVAGAIGAIAAAVVEKFFIGGG